MTDDDIRLAERLADAAGAAIRPFFRARYDLEQKADASPVTEADRVAEAAMRAILEAERPPTASSARNMARRAAMPSGCGCSIRSTARAVSWPAARSSER